MGTVVVVGGSGFLGSHTVRKLIASEYTVWATHGPGKTAPPIKGARWVGVELTQPGCADSLPDQCDHLVFLAQSRSWRRFPEGAEDIFAVNVVGLHQMLRYAVRAGARSVVVASSGSVYSDQSRAARESDVVDLEATRSYYVATKLASEILLGPYANLLTIVQLRLFMPYGPGQNADMLVPQLVGRVKEGQAITLHGEDGLLANPVAAADVANAVTLSLNLPKSALLNVAGPKVLSLREIGTTIGEVLGQEVRFEVQPEAVPPVLVGETALLRGLLEWEPDVDLETGLREWLTGSAAVAA